MPPDQKLKICKQTRKYAADALYKVLKELLPAAQPISEVLLRDAWLTELRKNNDIFSDGWYTPPPHGIIALFSDDQNVERISYKSARPEKNWPKNDTYLNSKNGIIYLYASPVDKNSGIIGDFGITLYFGNKPEIKTLLKTCLRLDKEIFEFSKLGMELSEITLFTEKRLKHYGMQNMIESITDTAIIKNKTAISIGHTIPFSNENSSNSENKILKNGLTDWEKAKDMISNKRIFVNSLEKFKIKPACAFTIEPRSKIINKPYLPTSLSYHTIAVFKTDGSKELLTNFDNLFKLAGMDYIL